MTAAKEMRHWNPEAHIGDDGYVLADIKAAARGANAPRPGQRGANAPQPAQRGANAPRPAQRGANAPRPAQRGANAPRLGASSSRGGAASSASPTRISAYGGKSSLSPIKLRKKHSKKRYMQTYMRGKAEELQEEVDASLSTILSAKPNRRYTHALAEAVDATVLTAAERVLGVSFDPSTYGTDTNPVVTDFLA
eukprot:jgi/Tetstr1/466263/TSEL_010819.t1